MELEWIESTRNQKVPVYKGFRFKLKNKPNGENGKKYWRCVRTPNCSVTLITERENFYASQGNHIHAPDTLEVQKKKVISRMKKKMF